MSEVISEKRAGLEGLARNAIIGWAFFGGIILSLVVAINVISVIGGVVWKPFPGDFEMTEIGVAVAAFAFLPYCQMVGANVTADIFTARAPYRLVAVFSLLASIVALGFSLLLLSRMYFGMLDQKAYNYTTAILQFPHWVAFIPILISLALLAVAATITLLEDIKKIRKP
ncbi:TRAP transporter small permease [Oricola nitratireducens]|jgi:TRAP-type C4-dicarboxylate transport system permease small subunit|uniref:TRAP transporter small permease n=1 Tax=Oricola nitratireducens TaxID=2775868 RepID=UPI001866D9A7|nr:TRAP transporter small permease [Oricola nitratireducens]